MSSEAERTGASEMRKVSVPRTQGSWFFSGKLGSYLLSCSRSIFVTELIKQINRQSCQLLTIGVLPSVRVRFGSARSRVLPFYLPRSQAKPSYWKLETCGGNKMARNKKPKVNKQFHEKMLRTGCGSRRNRLWTPQAAGEPRQSSTTTQSWPRFRFRHSAFAT